MLVSHFELIFKPQAPGPVDGTPVDRVIQGYFLEVTNLEAKEYLYRLEFVAVPPLDTTPNKEFRSIAGNTLLFVDTPGNDNRTGTLSGAFTDSVFRPIFSSGVGSDKRYIRIAPQATALVAVLPSAFGPTPIDMTPLTLPLFEVRGFVNITLPTLRTGRGFKAQSSAPVKILLTPQNRATFLTADGSINGQIQATLPTATGKAEYAVPPERGFTFSLPFNVVDGLPKILAALEQDTSVASVDELSGEFAKLKPKPADLAAFKTALAQATRELEIPARR